MILKHYKLLLFTLAFLSGGLILFQEVSFCAEDDRIAIVVSKRIKPYMAILEGMTGELEKKGKNHGIFFLPDPEQQGVEEMTARLETGPFNFYAAIGPEAASLVWTLTVGHPRVFAAVLDPAGLFQDQTGGCGISLQIPVETQVREISQRFVNIKKIGLLFDAKNNDWFFQAARAAALPHGINIVPLRVESRNQITDILDQNWQNMDCVWMIPDQTIISEKIIQHIIKLALYQTKGVIGYNSFFIRSGAFFAFDFDYQNLGIQAARKIEAYAQTGQCEPEPPEFQTLMNERMIEKIGFKVKE